MVTAQSRAEDVVAAREAGADGYIVEPFTAQTSKAKIDEALATP